MRQYYSVIKNFLKYPRKINQSVFNANMIFKVHNLIEEDRVIGSNSEIEFTKEIISELGFNDRYFDIGSCIGFTAISAALHSGCMVSAFEPDAELAEHLRLNVGLNHASDKIEINQWAVSNIDGTMDFFTSGADGVSPSLAKTQGQKNKVTVKTYRIDSAIREGHLQPPSVIKIDIEGAELMALMGMSETLSTSHAPRTIFIETHPQFMQHFNHNIEMLQQFMRDKNYKEIYMKERGGECHHKFVKV